MSMGAPDLRIAEGPYKQTEPERICTGKQVILKSIKFYSLIDPKGASVVLFSYLMEHQTLKKKETGTSLIRPVIEGMFSDIKV